jgi:hypothetical protein
MGSIFLKSGIRGLVVVKNPNCIRAAKTPESATMAANGKTIRANSLKIVIIKICTSFLSKSIPM